MEIKYTIQGLLIYQAILFYLLAFLLSIAGFKRSSNYSYVLGFAFVLAGVIYRGINVGHIPLQNLFEVFLFLGMAIGPIYLLCSKLLKIEILSADSLIAAIILFPAGFIFSAQPQQLPPALQSWLFAPHVAVYMIAYVLMTKAAYYILCRSLSSPSANVNITNKEQGSYKLVCLGFPFLTLGLILGSIWAKLAWGDYWGWDPKELWSLATWLVYVFYFHFRTMHYKYKNINASLIILGFVFIVITLLWANLSRIFAGLHNYA